MISVISLFSLLNDDCKIENGRIFPVINSTFNNSFNFENTPFLIIFTDKNQ